MAKRIVELAIELTDGVYNLFGIRCDDTTSTPVPLPLAGAMLGDVKPTVIAFASLPAYLLPCDGSSHLRTDYPDLYALLDSTFIVDADHFVTPDLRGRTVIGSNGTYAVGSTGGEVNHTLTTGEMPSHTHTQDSHNHTQNTHTHTQDSHNHTQNLHGHTGNSHGHSTNDPGHFHDMTHGHNIPTRTTSAAGTQNELMAANGSGTVTTKPSGNSPTVNTGSKITGISIDNSVASVQDATATNLATTATNQSTTATNQATTATNQNTGGGGAHNNLQPYLALNYVIVALAV